MDRNRDFAASRPKNSVALRKESVDRNITSRQLPATEPPSLSARRAWIEITVVATLATLVTGRSPQGERG